MIEAFGWLIVAVVLLIYIVVPVTRFGVELCSILWDGTRQSKEEQKRRLQIDILRLEQELDLDDTCKTKRPKAPRPQRIDR